MKTTFIYALCEPGTRTVRYIGKSNRPKRRFWEHVSLTIKHKTHLGCWLRSLRVLGKEPNLIVLREVPIDQWELAEERYIRLARGCGMNLVNGTDGGDGLNNPSSETRAKLSAKMAGKFDGDKNPFFGHTHTPETRARMRESHLNVPLAKEHAANIGLSHLGSKRSPETREKMRLAQLGEKHHNFGGTQSEESNAKRRVKMSGAGNPQFGKTWTPEHREAIRATKALRRAEKEERDQKIEWALAPYTLE